MTGIGVPSIQNYTRREYRGGTQNWGIAQDPNGFMYFANNEGVLSFDGTKWRRHRMPNSSIVRSVYIDKTGHIYAGAYNEFGQMTINANGQMKFQSFKNHLPKECLNFDDIQHINRQNGLQNNTVLKVFTDWAGNLWLGLDNGIDYLNVNSPITFLQQNDGIGAGYTSIIYKGKIYLGTNQGLYVKEWDLKRQIINTRYKRAGLVPWNSWRRASVWP